jgi:hypothetical protein
MEYLYTTARGQVHIIEAASVRQAWQRAKARHVVAILFEPDGKAWLPTGSLGIKREADADVSADQLAKLREQVGGHRVPQPDPLATAHDLLRRIITEWDGNKYGAVDSPVSDEARALVRRNFVK